MLYNTHNIYGLSEAAATHAALETVLGKRPFILTRQALVYIFYTAADMSQLLHNSTSWPRPRSLHLQCAACCAAATHAALKAVLGKRPFILTRWVVPVS